MTQKLFLAVLFITLSLGAFAQNSTIVGKVIDEKNAEVLIGAVVQIKGTSYGSSTDLNGDFVIKGVPVGTYTLIGSYLSYETKEIAELVVKVNEPTTINIALKKVSKNLGTATVVGKLRAESNFALLAMQKNSVSVSDGVSADNIRRTPDKNTSDVLKRVSGASIQDNKFAIIRGLNDRYNAAYINGAPLPSSESDRKAFAFDIFPSNMLDNLIITKTATPDMPAEFSGGIIQINTKDVPEKNFTSLTITEGYNLQTTGEAQLYQTGGKTDWLGLDDGSRALASTIPTASKFPTKIGDQAAFAKKITPYDWSIKQKTFSPNTSLQYSLGLSKAIDKSTLAFVGALTYSKANNYNETTRKGYTGSDTAFSLIQYDLLDRNYNTSVLWGALANLSLKINKYNTISFKNIYSVNSDNRIVNRTGNLNPLEANPTLLRSNNIQFVSNKIFSNQLNGDHYLVDSKIRINWLASFSSIERLIPNERRNIYTRFTTFLDTAFKNPADTTYKANVSLSNVGADYGGGMFWSQNNESIRSFKVSLSRPFYINEFVSELKIGGLYQERFRTFSARRLGYTKYGISGGTIDFKDSLLYLPEDKIFASENMGLIKPAVKGGANAVGGFKLLDDTRPSDTYTASSYLTAMYFMFDHKYKFARLIWGVRMENFVQTLYARKNTNPADDIKLDTVKRDYLPSANLILSLSKKQNIRFAYSQTVNRPEYRELAPFAFYDFSTQLVVSGRDSLSRAKIHNLDFRYEYYPGRGQLLSTSVFYKKFIDPIETISLSYTDNEITYRNLKEAQNYGLEIEYRVLLAALLKADSIAFLNNLTVFSNLAIIRSKVNTTDVVGSGAADRPLQGQSPYVFNAGLLYINDKLNCSFAASFNRVGSRIYIVGNVNEPAIWEAPRSFMDFQFSKLLWKKRIELKLNVQNSLAQNQNFYQNKFSATNQETTVKGVKGVFNKVLTGDSQNVTSYNSSKDDLIWSTKYAPIISLGITVKL